MHQVAIPPEILAAARGMRGGREHMFDDLDPARTAHVIIDMQNGYMEEGAPLEVPFARAVVPQINAISQALRRAGGTNVFIQYGMRAEAEQSWSTWHGQHNSPESLAVTRASFEPGTHHWQLWSELAVEDGDLVIEKQRFSAFIPGTCSLDQTLRARGIDTLIITGTMTNVCCESTARDAMQMNYRVIFASDATATWTDAAHNGTLANMCMVFADVMSAAEIVALLDARAA
jgi:ureidoacrylate peracid hydrolase